MAAKLKITADLVEKVGEYILPHGTAKYHVPSTEAERLASQLSTELGREVLPVHIQKALRKAKKDLGVPIVQGHCSTTLVQGNLITMEPSELSRRRSEARRRSGNGDGSQNQNQEENQSNVPVPAHLKPFENAIKKQVKAQTFNLRKELMEARMLIRELKIELSEYKDKLKEAVADCNSSAAQYKELSIAYETKMAEMRHMQKIIEAVDEYTAYKRSTMKRKTDAII